MFKPIDFERLNRDPAYAIDLSIEAWSFLRDNKYSKKSSVPILFKVYHTCPLCHYANFQRKRNPKRIWSPIALCDFCPMREILPRRLDTSCLNGYYGAWAKYRCEGLYTRASEVADSMVSHFEKWKTLNKGI